MLCQRFELIGCFLHVVTPEEEEVANGDRLKKLRPYIDHLKTNYPTYYQPLQCLSVKEHMVKSKSHSQYMQNKTVKCGFQLWFVPFHSIERASKLIATFASCFGTSWAGPLGTCKS